MELARPLPFGCFMLAMGLLLGHAVVRADKLPEDTSTIESLTPEQARMLVAAFKGDYLHLNKLTSLDADTARALAGFNGKCLGLSGLPALDQDAAKALAEFRGKQLELDNLAKLDAGSAKALAALQCPLILGGLITLDATTAECLAAYSGPMLGLQGVTSLDSDTAKSLAKSKSNWLVLGGLTTLDAKAAEALAEFKGEALEFDGLSSLEPDTAKALATSAVRRLRLRRLADLDADIAAAFSQFGGQLDIPDKVRNEFLERNPLTPQNALTYAVMSQGTLGGITALESPESVAIAKALAAKKGWLSLPNLKKISPKTLTALLEKEDISIPLIETLELIQEPDGSVTEDFVIPERFQRAQQRQSK